MLRLHGLAGHERDAALHDRLHDLEQAGVVEQVFIDEGERGRRRFRLTSDRGSDCAISLDREEALTDGAVLLAEPDRAVLVRIGAPRLWRLRPATTAAAVRLGWSAGALHWRVRFDGDDLVIVLDGNVGDYRARIADLLAARGVTEVTEGGPPADRDISVSADTAALLTALQFSDSAFPSGGFAFSWGLEGLQADGLAGSAEDVAEIAAEQLRQRWATMDKILLARAHAASGPDELAGIDVAAEVACTSGQLRSGSRRAGRALIGMAARLGYPGALSYRAVVTADERLGHLPVVQGLVFREAGLDGPTAQVLSAWSLLNGLTSAAIRLGLIGHVDAQHLMITLRPVVAAVVDGETDLGCPLSSFTPLLDIAVSRRDSRDLNLFAT